MKTTERLLAAAKDIWAAYNEHPFVLGIQDGTLAWEKFKYYIIQDYLYLEEYAKVFALGIAKAKKSQKPGNHSAILQVCDLAHRG